MAIEDEHSRSQVLVAIAAQLPASEPQLLQQALDAAMAIEDEHSRAKILNKIRLPESQTRLKIL